MVTFSAEIFLQSNETLTYMGSRTTSESEYIPATLAPSPNVFVTTGGNYLSEVEREMMIDSEEFEDVDPHIVIKHLLSEIIENAITTAEEKENRAPLDDKLATPKETNSLPKSLSCNVRENMDDNLLIPGVTFESSTLVVHSIRKLLS